MIQLLLSLLFTLISVGILANPVFEQNPYEFMLLTSSPKNTIIGRVKATDPSFKIVDYFLMEVQETHKYNYEYLKINKTGFLTTTAPIPKKSASTLRVFVGAENEVYSISTTTLIVYLTDISDPLNLAVSNVEANSARICWDPPKIGKAEGYTIEIYPAENNGNIRGGSVVHDSENNTCELVQDLIQDTEYNINIYGYNRKYLGMNSQQVAFRTKTSKCAEESHKSAKGEIRWPSTLAFDWSYVQCPKNSNATARRYCNKSSDGNAYWERPILSNCSLVEIKSAEQAQDAVYSLLSDLKSASNERMARVLSEAAETLLNVVQFAANDTTLTESAIQLIDLAGKASDEELQEVEHKFPLLLQRLAEEANFQLNITMEQFTIETRTASSEEDETFADENIQMELPASALNNEEKVLFIAYQNSKFFQDKRFCWQAEQESTHVITASVLGRNVSELTEKERFRYSIKVKNGSRLRKCAFWNEKQREWMEEGMETILLNDTMLCTSSHLTSFAILLDPDPETILSCEHQLILTILSYTGSSISIICLIITIGTHLLYRKTLLKEKNRQVLLSLCFSLLFLHLTYVIGSRREKESSVVLCGLSASFIHYFLIASLTWMTIEGHHMYQLLVIVFHPEDSYFLLKRSVIGWGLPTLPVLIALCADYTVYKGTRNTCSISSDDRFVYYSLYFGPALMLIIINIFFYFILVQVVLAPRKTEKKWPIRVSQVIGAFALSSFLGISWIFGAVAIRKAKLVFFYIFCICNSLQGAAIFFFRCVRSPEIRNHWKETLSRPGSANIPLSTSEVFGRRYSDQIPQ